MNAKAIIAGAALLWYAVLRGARGLKIGVDSYSFEGLDLNSGTAKLNINVRIKNPLVVGVTIKGITGDVYAQGEKIGYVNTTYNYYLSGGHTHILPVVVNIQFGGAWAAIKANINSGDFKTITVAFDGKVQVGNMNLPLKFELDYNDLTK